MVKRDLKIKKFNEEEIHTIRMKNQLAITSSIQQNFLPKDIPLENKTGITIAARYFPAEEAAGDWYHYYYDERCEEVVIALADVSGHGAGAAMFVSRLFKQLSVVSTPNDFYG